MCKRTVNGWMESAHPHSRSSSLQLLHFPSSLPSRPPCSISYSQVLRRSQTMGVLCTFYKKRREGRSADIGHEMGGPGLVEESDRVQRRGSSSGRGGWYLLVGDVDVLGMVLMGIGNLRQCDVPSHQVCMSHTLKISDHSKSAFHNCRQRNLQTLLHFDIPLILFWNRHGTSSPCIEYNSLCRTR